MRSVETIELFHKFPFQSIVVVALFSYLIYRMVRNRHNVKNRPLKAIVLILLSFVLAEEISNVTFYVLKKPFLIFDTQGICYQNGFYQTDFIKWDDVKKIIVGERRSKLLSFAPRCAMDIKFKNGSRFAINAIDYHVDEIYSMANKYLPAEQLHLIRRPTHTFRSYFAR